MPDRDAGRGRSCAFALHTSAVFITKYRRGVFTDEYLSAIHPTLARVYSDFGAVLVEFNGEDDPCCWTISPAAIPPGQQPQGGVPARAAATAPAAHPPHPPR